MPRPALLALLLLAPPASAHFGMVIPSDPLLDEGDGRSVRLLLSFSHPFERSGMVLERPVAFGVTHDGVTTSLLGDLEPVEVMGAPGFALDVLLDRPGAHAFSMEPQPYWEAGEDSYIVHHTKAYVGAFGSDVGWDAELGLRTEIMPLTRPFGLWVGNVFQGRVLLDGEPVPGIEVEIEHLNEGGAVAPSDLLVTQVVRADADGVFTYAAPAPGWWGFAALSAAPETLEHEGEPKPVELGAVLWVRFEAWAAP